METKSANTNGKCSHGSEKLKSSLNLPFGLFIRYNESTFGPLEMSLLMLFNRASAGFYFNLK